MSDHQFNRDDEITTRVSPRKFDETVERLLELLRARGMKVFGVIDQQGEARQAGLDLRPTTLVLFGHPTAGTPVMQAAPLAALDLPLKVLVWQDGDQTLVSYYSPTVLAERHELGDLAANIAGIEGLVESLVSE